MTNSRRFNLDYDVTGTGAAGVARVELWITENDGQTWRPYGLDPDRMSPMLVELDHEGVFGFRLLIHNQEGISARPPQPGDEADLWIGLDWTPPRAELQLAEPVAGTTPLTLRIQWRAEDEFLTELPIELSYAPGPDGPWSQVTGPLANTGSYTWVPTERLPARAYLRLQVRDRAGNVATDRPMTPLGASAEPQAVIRGLRAVPGGP
jgi:hypothetical protein